MSHHAVYHKQKLSIRIVFICSLKFNGISLNDNLLQGPDLTSNLFVVLLRFRQAPVAFVADVRKMFYQVRVPKHHANLMRFFWFDSNNKIVEFRVLVHVFGATSSPSVANYALQQTVKDVQCDVGVANSVKNNFYVDDLLKSVDTEQQDVTLMEGIEEVLDDGGLKLASYNCNRCSVLDEISGTKNCSNEQSTVSLTLPSSSNLACKNTLTLGVVCNIHKDCFGFNVKFLDELFPDTTKRMMLKTLSSLYDPLGLISPVAVQAKLLFQEACCLRIHWDDELTVDILTRWSKWKESILELKHYEIKRCFKFRIDVHSYELNLFCNGSEKAYGAVAYVTCSYSNNSSSSLVASKSRLTPMNNTTLKTVLRIELAAAKLAIELYLEISSELEYNFSKTTFWSDSTNVLGYIKSYNGRFHRYVANKISFILNFSNPEQWKYVNTKENPA